METVIESYLNDFCDQFNFKSEELSKQFEDFTNYITIPKIEDTHEAIESVSIGNKGNPGIDGLAVVVNDHIVNSKEEVDYFLNALGRLEVEFYFVQAKTTSSFSMTEITSYINCVKDFFNEKTSYQFNDETLRLHEIKEYIYTKTLKMQQNPSLHIIYACTGQWNVDQNIKAAIDTSLKELRSKGYFSEVIFKTYDRDLLKSSYRELRNSISRSIVFEKHSILPSIKDVDEAFIGMLPATEYIKLICNDQDEMLRNIYYDNVRDFQGFNAVNNEIKETLTSNDDQDKFALLNNGVTIVAKKIKKTGTTFNISDYQIVNGCQTSHVIYYNRRLINSSIYIPIKLIVTQNYDLMSKIIRANNRQTTVGSEAFEILSPFHKYLEEFYLAESKKLNIELFYERRSNQYDQNNFKRTNYITLSNQIKSVSAMFFNEPHNSMQRYFGELLQIYKSKVFQEGDSGFPYFVSGLALSRIEVLFTEHKIDKKYKRFKYHILMLLRVLNTDIDDTKLNSKTMEKECQSLIELILDEKRFTKSINDALIIIQRSLDSMGYNTRNAHGLSSFTDKILPRRKINKSCGTITYYNENRGFGYLDVNAPQDIFFHISDYHAGIDREPEIGEKLYFDVVDGEKGLRAINIQQDA